MSESNLHTHDDLPIVLAGSANGQIKGNRHLVYPRETQLNNLLLNMFDAADVPHVTGFGDSTGRLVDDLMPAHTRRSLVLVPGA